MVQLIDKSVIIAEIERYKHKADERLKIKNRAWLEEMKDLALQNLCGNLLNFINTLEVKEVDSDSGNENVNHKITVGTKIRLKANPCVILSIISNDCHGDEFECSNGSVLSLKQIEKYYDICTEEK